MASQSYTNANLRLFTVEQGSYLLIYKVTLQNLTASAISLSFFQASISTTNNALDEDYKTANMSSQSVTPNFNTSLSGCFYYQNVSGTQKTLYLNYLTTTTLFTMRGFIQVVRIG